MPWAEDRLHHLRPGRGRGVDIFPIAFVGNVPLEIEEPGDPLGLYRLRHIVGKLALRDCVLSLGVFEDKC